MNFILVGMSHKTAPIEVREQVSIPEDQIPGCLAELMVSPEIQEGMILSTCNRTEVLVGGNHVHHCVDGIKDLLLNKSSLGRHELGEYLYVLTGEDAISHVFKVTSSLDSMVIGEPQILGQVKDAYRMAVDSGTCGPILNKLLHSAFRVAKRIRTDTGIGRNAVSVSYAAVELARNIFESIVEKTIFLIGAGDMVELAARHFVQQGVKRILITNRTFSRTESLAVEFGGEAIPFEEFRERLSEADIILSCTGAQGYIMDVDDVKRTLKLRKNRAIFIIDIAVPRDIDPHVNQLENAYLYDIDDLENVVDRNLAHRNQELKRGNIIVDREVRQFKGWMQSLEITPTIKEIREKAERIRQQELKKTLAHLRHLDRAEQESLESMTRSIVNKILHPTIMHIKKEGGVNGQKVYVDVARKLLGLDEVDEDA
jgi:glutamyl-tRNA reductase